MNIMEQLNENIFLLAPIIIGLGGIVNLFLAYVIYLRKKEKIKLWHSAEGTIKSMADSRTEKGSPTKVPQVEFETG